VTEPIEIVKGQPDADEVAAVVLALEIVAARTVAPAPTPASRWRMTYRPTDARQTPNVSRANANWER
jgi:Acyl-CoA carboxylase epsilon subunit